MNSSNSVIYYFSNRRTSYYCYMGCSNGNMRCNFLGIIVIIALATIKLGPRDAWFVFVMRHDLRIVYMKKCV